MPIFNRGATVTPIIMLRLSPKKIGEDPWVGKTYRHQRLKTKRQSRLGPMEDRRQAAGKWPGATESDGPRAARPDWRRAAERDRERGPDSGRARWEESRRERERRPPLSEESCLAAVPKWNHGESPAESRKSLLSPISAACRAEFRQARRLNLIQESSFLQDGPGLNDLGAQNLGLLHTALEPKASKKLQKATKSSPSELLLALVS